MRERRNEEIKVMGERGEGSEGGMKEWKGNIRECKEE
jgi:hypothetical protein